MSGKISINRIVDATLTGVEVAQATYERWSGGYWLWQAPEYLAVVYVAKRIAKLRGSKFVTLEESAKNAISEAGAKGRGKLPRDIRAFGRIDIVLWWATGLPRAIIEIKNQLGTRAHYEADIKRIKQFLQRRSQDSSLQFGLFAFYHSAYGSRDKTASEKVQSKMNRVVEDVNTILGEKFQIIVKTSNIQISGSDAWIAVCILIRLK